MNDSNKPFRKCALPQCSGLRFNLVHKFPRNARKLLQWLEAIGNPYLSNETEKRLNMLFLCCRHFRVDDYINAQSKKLHFDAVPSLNLKELNELDKCRHTEAEKAKVLTSEEIQWLSRTENASSSNTNSPSATNSTALSSPTSSSTKLTLPTIDTLLPPEVASMHRTICEHISTQVATVHIAAVSPTDFTGANASSMHSMVAIGGSNSNETSPPSAAPAAPRNTPSPTAAENADSSAQIPLPANDIPNADASNSISSPDSPVKLGVTRSSTVPRRFIPIGPLANNKCPHFTLYVEDEYLEFNDYMRKRTYQLSSVWLRSLCRCYLCYDPHTDGKIINVFDLPLNLLPVIGNVSSDMVQLEIMWNDRHESIYNLLELYALLDSNEKPHYYRYESAWSTMDTRTGDAFEPMNCLDLLMDQGAIQTALRRIKTTGVLVLTGIPRCESASVVKRTIISKLFSNVWDNVTAERRSQFCEVHNYPHTNCTFDSIDKGVQILTVPYHKDNLRVKLTLADGLAAAMQLLNISKMSFDILAFYENEHLFTNNEGFKHVVRGKVIEMKGRNERILYAPFHLYNLQHEQFTDMGHRFKRFGYLMSEEENQWHVSVDTETFVILDNYRICWCIGEHHPDNELDCYYLERKHFLSALAQLED